MTKLTKSDTMLNEKDAIQDMLESEKQLISFYATALFEGSTKNVRKLFSTNLNAVADNQYSLFNQMSTRGYYQPAPAQKQMIDQTNDTFKKLTKELKAQG
jgi:spore coat protein CotF